MKETQPHSEEEKTFFVKLHHYRNGNIPCKNDGISETFSKKAFNKAQLRTIVESSTFNHFKGDCCKLCSAHAKVFIQVVDSDLE